MPIHRWPERCISYFSRHIDLAQWRNFIRKMIYLCANWNTEMLDFSYLSLVIISWNKKMFSKIIQRVFLLFVCLLWLNIEGSFIILAWKHCSTKNNELQCKIRPLSLVWTLFLVKWLWHSVIKNFLFGFCSGQFFCNQYEFLFQALELMTLSRDSIWMWTLIKLDCIPWDLHPMLSQCSNDQEIHGLCSTLSTE